MTKKLVVQILFYGSLWGIVEATLGYALHWIPATIAGSILFPIAGLILYKAYQETNSRLSLMYMGLVAASIKAVDFYLPQISIYKTLNPMISILMEALLVVLVVNLLVDPKPGRKYLALPIASIGWRALFLAWMVAQFYLTGNQAPYIQTIGAASQFLLVSGLLSGLIGSLFVWIADHVTLRLPSLSSNWVFASLALILAIATTVAL